VSGPQLATLLADETTLRLAVLNACEGARNSLSDPFSGVASCLVQREIPAVIAMQLEITDRAAITFAGELYSALADGYPVDAALAEARKAIFADRNDVEWATPVLFMRVADGRIFDIPAGPVDPGPPDVEDADDGLDDGWPTSLTPTVTTEQPPLGEGPVPIPQRVPAGLMRALVACTGLLALGVVYPWDHHRGGRSWLRPYFGTLPNSTGGFITALAPVALVVLAGLACWLAHSRRLQLAAGVLLGTGFVGAGKYLGLLARILGPAKGDGSVRVDSAIVFVVMLLAAGSLVVAAIRVAQIAHTTLGRHGEGRLNAGVAVGALLVVGGCVWAYNGGGDGGKSRAIISSEGSQAIEPLAVAVALAALVLVLPYLPRALGAGVLIALGVDGVALWIRYAAIPIVEDRTVASPQPGGFLGIAGGLVAFVIGVRMARAHAKQPTAAAAWSR
jgi:hypothetical protein